MRGEGRGWAWIRVVWSVRRGPALRHPGHTPRAYRFARTRPLSLERKGRWIPAYAGMTAVSVSGGWPRVRPGHPPLAALAPPYAGAKGAMDSCLRRNDGGVAGMTGVARDSLQAAGYGGDLELGVGGVVVGEVLGVALVVDAYVVVGEDVVGAVAVGGFVDPEGLVGFRA